MDIFNRTPDTYGGAFTADSAKLTFSGLAQGNSLLGLLVQQMQASYQQPLTKVFELGSNAIYYIVGRTSGSLNINRISGPRKLGAAFYSKFADACQARTNTMQFAMLGGCGFDAAGNAQEQYTCNFVVITTLTIGVTSQDTIVNNGIQATFSSFLYD
jgi:hypothetical protein